MCFVGFPTGYSLNEIARRQVQPSTATTQRSRQGLGRAGSSLVPTGVRHPMAISGKSGPTSTRTSGGHCPSLFSTQVLLRIFSLRGQFPTRIAQPKNRPRFNQPNLFRPLAITEATDAPTPKNLTSSRGQPAEPRIPFLVAKRIELTKITNTPDRAE